MAKFIEVHPCPYASDNDSKPGLFFSQKEAAELIRVETVKKAWIHIVGEEYFCAVHYYDECTKTERRAMFGLHLYCDGKARDVWNYSCARRDFEELKSLLDGYENEVKVEK